MSEKAALLPLARNRLPRYWRGRYALGSRLPPRRRGRGTVQSRGRMVSQQPAPAKELSIAELAFKLVGTAGGIVAGLRFLWEALSGEAPSVYDLVAYAGTAGIGAVLGMVALGLVVGIGVLAMGKADELAGNESLIKVTNAIGAAVGALVSVLFGGTETDYPWLLQAIGVAVLLLLAYTIVVGRLPDL